MPSSTTPSLRSKIMWHLYKMPIWKRIIIFAIPIIAIPTIIGSIFAINDVRKVLILNKEISELQQAGEDMDEKKFYEICERTQSKADEYVIVEKSTKNYLCSMTRDFNDLTDQLSDNGIINAMDIGSLRLDDESFSNTHAYMADTRAYVEEMRKKDETYFYATGVLDFLEGELSDSMRQSFLDYTIDYVDTAELEDTFLDLLDTISGTTEVYDEALDYLTAHRGNWQLEGESIIFEDDAYMEEYWQILDKVTELAKTYNDEHAPTAEDLAADATVDAETETNKDEFDRSNFNMPIFY